MGSVNVHEGTGCAIIWQPLQFISTKRDCLKQIYPIVGLQNQVASKE